MPLRRSRVVQRPQRHPAGVKLRIRRDGWRLGAVHRCDTVGALGVANIQQFARKHPAFRPPGIRIDQRCRIARRGSHHVRGFPVLLLAPQILRLGKDIGGVARPRPVHLRAASWPSPAISAKRRQTPETVIRIGELGDASGGFDLAFIEHGQHARQMVLARNDPGKLLEDHRFLAVFQLLRAPEGAQGLPRARRIAAGHIGAGEDHHALGRLRRRIAEGAYDDGRGGILLVERPFGIVAEGRHARPARQFRGGIGDLRAWQARRIGKPDGPGQDMAVERLRRQPVADAERPVHIAGGNRIEAALETAGNGIGPGRLDAGGGHRVRLRHGLHCRAHPRLRCGKGLQPRHRHASRRGWILGMGRRSIEAHWQGKGDAKRT